MSCSVCGAATSVEEDDAVKAIADVLDSCPECSGGSLNGAALRCGNTDHHILIDAIRNSHDH